MSQVLRSPKSYDVCIVGSGAGGGMAAKILTEGGLNVVLLEAGPNVNPEKDFKMLMWPYELPHRGAGVGGRASENFSEFLAPNGAWTIDGEPYTSAPGANFQWFRSRIVGGRTNHWGRIALRFAPIDFTSGTRDGLGDDWPITYQDIAPYYDKVESYIGVFGSKENISSAPDGVFLPPPKAALHRTAGKKSLRQAEHSFASQRASRSSPAPSTAARLATTAASAGAAASPAQISVPARCCCRRQ